MLVVFLFHAIHYYFSYSCSFSSIAAPAPGRSITSAIWVIYIWQLSCFTHIRARSLHVKFILLIWVKSGFSKSWILPPAFSNLFFDSCVLNKYTVMSNLSWHKLHLTPFCKLSQSFISFCLRRKSTNEEYVFSYDTQKGEERSHEQTRPRFSDTIEFVGNYLEEVAKELFDNVERNKLTFEVWINEFTGSLSAYFC